MGLGVQNQRLHLTFPCLPRRRPHHEPLLIPILIGKGMLTIKLMVRIHYETERLSLILDIMHSGEKSGNIWNFKK